MRSPFISGSIFLGLSLAAVADVVRGTLLNDDEPYFIGGDNGNIYKAEWYGGSILFYEGDEVILTNDSGLEKMIDDTTNETAEVMVEEISPGYPRIIPRPVPTPNFSSLAPYPAVPTPTQQPTLPPAPTPDYYGRMLIHPEHSVLTHVVNVAPNDTLDLRSGPGTRFNPVTEIPPNGTDIRVLDQDRTWDGDSWWFAVEWHGFRGYVGQHYLPIYH